MIINTILIAVIIHQRHHQQRDKGVFFNVILSLTFLSRIITMSAQKIVEQVLYFYLTVCMG